MIKPIVRTLLVLIVIAEASTLFAQSYTVIQDACSSENADFAPMFYKEGLIFCSNRNQKMHKNDRDSLQKYRTDLFYYSPEMSDAGAELFSRNITTWLNEGPSTFSEDGMTLFYTGNLEPQNLTKKDKIKVYKLGIFTAKFVDGEWMVQEPFPHNTSDNKYDVAHPALFNQGKSLIFASNMPGSIGGTDLFISHLENGVWTTPVNLGEPVNSENDELFPFVDHRGRLYFSSNRGAGDMNVYYTVEHHSNWRKPILLPAPINSEFDDFGFISRANGERGFLSSNRLDGADDNIFRFSMDYPELVDCNPVHRTSYCYRIEEEEVMNTEGLPLVYEWDLGDGQKARGLSVTHCYATTGLYKATLNIIDTITGLTYAEVSSTMIDIQLPETAHIGVFDTLVVNTMGELTAIDEYLQGFDLEDWYWDFGDGERTQGGEVGHIFTEEGVYRIKLGGVSYPDEMGVRKNQCVYKDVVVVGQDKADHVSFVSPEKKVQQRKASSEGDESLASLIREEESASYFIELARSEKRIPYNSPLFDKVNEQITERYLSSEKNYSYSVGEGSTPEQLYSIFRTLADSGITDASIRGQQMAEFFHQTMKKGSFIAREDTSAINAEFRQLQDIKFEYNEDEILEESYANLNYIISMLEVEPSYKVQIRAHTDIIGGDNYNQKLSERRAKSVMKYFEERGIAKDRMEWFGFGSSVPIASNSTDEGRAQNRRVEFEIIELTKTAEQ